MERTPSNLASPARPVCPSPADLFEESLVVVGAPPTATARPDKGHDAEEPARGSPRGAARDASRLAATGAPQSNPEVAQPELMTVEDVRRRLGNRVSLWTLRKHLKAMRAPGSARQRVYLREADFQRLLELLAWPSNSVTGTASGTSAERSANSQHANSRYMKALALVAARPPTRSGPKRRTTS